MEVPPVDTLLHPILGWVLVIIYLYYEIRFGRIDDHLSGLDKKLTSSIVVIRAIVRYVNRIGPKDSSMDTQLVDEYLVENGMEPGDFIKDDIRADGGEPDDDE